MILIRSRVQPADAVVLGVADKNAAAGSQADAMRTIENARRAGPEIPSKTACRRAATSNSFDAPATRVDLANCLVFGVDHVQHAVGRGGDALGTIERGLHRGPAVAAVAGAAAAGHVMHRERIEIEPPHAIAFAEM